MDYSKSGGASRAKGAPRHSEHNQKGSTKNPYGSATDPKQDLIARMKAAAAAKAEKAAKE